MKTIELRTPFNTAQGKKVTSLKFNFDGLTVVDIRNAKPIGDTVFGSSVSVNTPRLDNSMVAGLAWVAAIKSNPELELTPKDILFMEPKDLFEIMELCQTEYLFR